MLDALLQELRLLDVSRRSLRSFGLLVGGILTVAAAWIIWRSTSRSLTLDGQIRPAAIVAVAGLALLVAAVGIPSLLKPVYYVWMALAVTLGAVMTRVVLSIVFVILIVPVGLVMKLWGRDPLNRRIDPSQSSYWVSREDMDRSAERLEKYF